MSTSTISTISISNKALQIYTQHQVEEEQTRSNYNDWETEQKKQIAEYETQLAPLKLEFNALETKIRNLQGHKCYLECSLNPRDFEQERSLAQKKMNAELFEYFKQNTGLVYEQLLEQSQRAQQIYADFIRKRVTRRLANNQFINIEIQEQEAKLTALMLQKDKIMLLPYFEAQELLKDIDQQIAEVQTELARPKTFLARLEKEDSRFNGTDLADYPLLNYSDTADIAEPYSQLQEIYQTWFKIYNEVWQISFQFKDFRLSELKGITINALYLKLLPFLHLYANFQAVFCDSTILSDKMCSNCGRGLSMIINIPNYSRSRYTIQWESHEANCEEGCYWACSDKTQNYQI